MTKKQYQARKQLVADKLASLGAHANSKTTRNLKTTSPTDKAIVTTTNFNCNNKQFVLWELDNSPTNEYYWDILVSITDISGDETFKALEAFVNSPTDEELLASVHPCHPLYPSLRP